MVLSPRMVAGQLRHVNKALIFDLDGTLVDSLPGIAATLNRTLNAHGLPGHTNDAIRGFVGNGLRKLIMRAAPRGADPALIDSLLSLYRKDYELTWASGTRIYPGVTQMLAELQDAGASLSVLSNKVHDFTLQMVSGMFSDIHFAVVLGQREGIPHKPDPTGALQIAAELGVSPADCVVIGDSIMDIETATNAGMHPVAVTWGYHDRERLIAAGASQLIDSPEQLMPLLSQRC